MFHYSVCRHNMRRRRSIRLHLGCPIHNPRLEHYRKMSVLWTDYETSSSMHRRTRVALSFEMLYIFVSFLFRVMYSYPGCNVDSQKVSHLLIPPRTALRSQISSIIPYKFSTLLAHVHTLRCRCDDCSSLYSVYIHSDGDDASDMLIDYDAFRPIILLSDLLQKMEVHFSR